MLMPNNLYTSSHNSNGAISVRANWHVCVVVLLLFVFVATLAAIYRDVRFGFDELAHASYVAYLQHTDKAWPDFKNLRMLDPLSFRFTREMNYLNHPSPYYVLLAHLGPTLEGHPRAIVVHRLLNVAFDAIGLAALMAIGLVTRLSRTTLYAYIVPLVCIPVLAPLAGSINNDNAAFAGGAIATLAAVQLVATGSPAWLITALGGLIIASWAKFTGLLLTGGLVGGVLLWLLGRGRLQAVWIFPIAIAALLAITPYVVLFVQYGSPTPSTPGQIAFFKAGAIAAGSVHATPMSPVSYASHFVLEFILQWFPTLKPRNTLNYVALLIPVTAVLCAFAGFMAAVRRIAGGKEGAVDIVVAAGGLAFAGTFVIHVIFNYLAFPWMTSAYPRYYLPLAALVPLAGLSLLGAVKRRPARAILVIFLIFGPVVFRLLGAPWS
jgi:hypothetical protein